MSKQGLELTFLAGLHKLDAASKTATFYIMNTSRNRNRWGVSEKALREASPSLKGKKLGMGSNYRIDKHYSEGESMVCGAFVNFDNQGFYLEGDAKIEDSKTLGMLKSGALGPISVVIAAYAVSCSKCGVEIEAKPGAAEAHACIKSGVGYEQVDSFVFHHVDFVDVPAYPQAGLLEMSAGKTYGEALELYASAYESQEPPSKLKDGITKIGDKKNLSEQKEISEKMAGLEQINKKLQSDYEAIKQASTVKDTEVKALTEKLAKATNTNDEVKALKAQLDAIAKEKHETLIADVAKARFEAGLTAKVEEEKVFLANFPDETLQVLKVDALKVASIMTQNESVPKTKYSAQHQSDLNAIIVERRCNFGFPALNKQEKEKN